MSRVQVPDQGALRPRRRWEPEVKAAVITAVAIVVGAVLAALIPLSCSRASANQSTTTWVPPQTTTAEP